MPSTDSPQLYNSRIIETYLKLIKHKYSNVNINELLSYSRMSRYEVADPGHWFTQEQIDLFYDRLVQETGNENIAREAGRYAASPDALGVLRQYVLGMFSPGKLYEMVGETAAKLTRSSRYTSRVLAKNKVEITVTPIEGIRERPFQCQNRMGFFEALVMMLNHDLPNIEHQECIFEGGSACRYVITWKNNDLSAWKKLRNSAVFGSLCVGIIAFALDFDTAIRVIFLLACMSGMLCLITEYKEKNAVYESLNKLWGSTDLLLEQININYNNALLTNEIGQTISSLTSIDAVLDGVAQVLQKRLDFDRGMILLANEDETQLKFKEGFGYPEELLEFLRNTSFQLDRPESKGVFVVAFRDKKPFLINDLNDIEGNLSPRSLHFAKRIGAKSFICCPIICEGRSLGILAVDNPVSKRPLVHSDISMLMGIAPVIGIAIRNADLLQTSRTQFSSILKVMAASIDARDPLTAGHSEKVTEYSLAICEELGLPLEYKEMVRVAALLHDYGKIAVPDAILKKNGPLSPDEFEIVKTHTYRTRDILQQINFDGIYRHVPAVAGAHHEKVDGSGYPWGLKGREIPLGARIIAVADFYDAITSMRHYREPMQREEAVALLEKQKGHHLDERVVDAFLGYKKRKWGLQRFSPSHSEKRGVNEAARVVESGPQFSDEFIAASGIKAEIEA